MQPSFCTPGNPLDMTAALCYDSDLYAEGLKTVMDDPNIEMVLIGITIQLVVSDPTIYNIYNGVKKVVEQGYTKPIAILPFIEGTRNQDVAEKFREIGVPILPSPKYAFSALSHLSKYIAYDCTKRELSLAVPHKKAGGRKKALSEVKSKRMLKESGIPLELGVIVTSREEVLAQAENVTFPVVMKIESDDILHKSDVGGVVLNIRNEKEAVSAYETILENVKNRAPDAKINGVLMQNMMPQGTELILGVKRDAQFGPMLLAGLGGVFVEVFGDSSLYPIPLNKEEARRMLEALKSYKMLKGCRGTKARDIDAVVEMMVSVSDFAEAHKDELCELDINPLFVYEEGQGTGVADALVVLEE